MRQVRPLSELLAAADSLTKTAAAPRSQMGAALELSSVLLSANTSVDVIPDTDDVSYEKVAEALSRVYVASTLDAIHKVDAFEAKATENGFTPEQVGEALSKVAAEKTLRHLPFLMGLAPLSGEDKNKLPNKPKAKLRSRLLGNYDSTKNEGY